MRGISRGGFVACFALVACGSGERFVPYAPSTSTRTLVFAVMSPDDRIELTAYDAFDAIGALHLDDIDLDTRIAMLEYDAGPTALELDLGALAIVDDDPSRPLPVPDRFFLSRPGAIEELAEATWAESVLANVAIRALPIEACVRAGGCFVAGSETCLSPCPPSPDLALPDPPAIVSPAAPPELAPCPSGWREVTRGSAALCEPPVVPGACDVDAAAFVDGAECERVGAPCGAGLWPTALPTDRPVLFVRPGEVGGDGTIGSPFGTVNEALDVAPSGAVVALSRGTHAGFSVELPVQIVGACVRETVLESSAEAVLVSGGALVLRDVRVRSGRCGLFVDGAEADVEGVVFETIDDPESCGFSSGGSSVRLRDVVVRGRGGNGGAARDGAVLAAERLVIEGPSTGLIFDEASGVVERVRMRGLERRTDAPNGALFVVNSSVAVSVASIEDVELSGALVTGPRSSLVMNDASLMRVATSTADERFAVGIFEGASASISRVAIESDAVLKIGVTDATLRANDIVLVTLEREGGSTDPVVLVHGGSVRIARALIDGGRDRGIDVGGGAQASIEDVAITGILDISSDRPTIPVRASDATTTLVASRLEVRQDVGIAVSATAEAFVEVSDLGVEGDATDSLLVGVSATSGAMAVIHRARFEGPWTFFGDDGRFEIEDVHVRNFGPGVGAATVIAGATDVEMHRVRIDGSPGHAVSVEGGRFVVSDLAVTSANNGGLRIVKTLHAEVRRYSYVGGRGAALHIERASGVTVDDLIAKQIERAPLTCNATCSGAAVVIEGDALDPGEARIRGLLFEGGTDWAVEISANSELSMSGGVVSGFPTGVLVRVPPFDVRSLLDGVLFREFDQLVQTTTR